MRCTGCRLAVWQAEHTQTKWASCKPLVLSTRRLTWFSQPRGGNPSSVTLSLRRRLPGAKVTLWEASATWRAWSKPWVLDFVVHHVADNPSGFS